jgi:hypothetical protein
MSVPGEGEPVVVPVVAPVDGAEVVGDQVLEPAVVTDEQAPDPVAERLAHVLEVAGGVGKLLSKEFAKRKAVVDQQRAEAQGFDLNPDGSRMRSSADVAMEAVAPTMAAVQIAKRPRTINPLSWAPGQATEVRGKIIYGWTVYESEHEAPQEEVAEGETKKPVARVDALAAEFGTDDDGDDALADQFEPVEHDPKAIIERVVVTNSKATPLWQIRGAREAIEKGDHPELTRIPIFPATSKVGENTAENLRAYADRNDFVDRGKVTVTPITVEAYTSGELTFEGDAAHIVDMIGVGIARLTRETFPARPAAEPTA